MFNFNRIDIQKIAAAAVGALILSTTAVSAAVGPAWSPDTNPGLYAQAVADEARA